MAHPNNEPGKTYDVDDQRRAAALSACDGLPTEALERGIVQGFYRLAAAVTLLDTMAPRVNGNLIIPSGWWDAVVRAEIDGLNDTVQPGVRQ